MPLAVSSSLDGTGVKAARRSRSRPQSAPVAGIKLDGIWRSSENWDLCEGDPRQWARAARRR